MECSGTYERLKAVLLRVPGVGGSKNKAVARGITRNYTGEGFMDSIAIKAVRR